jgi:two-component system phosphate regulon sensor histidine kinase PhoR
VLTEQFRGLIDPLQQPALDRLCKDIGRLVPTRLTVILPDGLVVGDSKAQTGDMENHSDRPEIMDAFGNREGASIRHSDTLGQRMMYVALPIRSGDVIRGVLRVSIAIDAIDKQLRSLQVRMALGGVAIAALASLVCLFISRRISQPLEIMRQGASRYARGDLSHRLGLPGTLELAGLAEAMNQMAKELEQRIQAVISQRNQTQAVLSSMAEGVVALDLEERIMDLNEAAARLLNRPKEHLRGRSLQEIMRSRDLQRMVRRTMSDGTRNEGDISLYHSGEQILSTRCTPLRDAGGNRIGVLLVLNNVTRLRRLENMRSDFAANVSHEIKTPLTAIQGFIETLHHGDVDDPEEARRFLGIIRRHVTRLTAIIDDLMHLSRLEQDDESFRPNPEPDSVREVILTAVQLCSARAREKAIDITVDADPSIRVHMDTDLMEQAVVNLLDNAVKYSPPERPVAVRVGKTGAEVTICVIDQGIGIPYKHLPRLFERFYRVDKARSRKEGGTGLGLAIVKHIIQAHGGRVTVESLQGSGSTFCLHLPVGSAPADCH